VSGGNLAISIVVGLAVGVLIGAAVGYGSAALTRGGDESNVCSSDLAGRSATVVTAIPEDGYGEVSFTVVGHLSKLNARCPGGLPAGTPVTITSVLSPTSVAVARRDA
jgi:membrane protein implicated in regulation of membrane protease activity